MAGHEQLETEIAVIGGGAVGLAIAHRLARAGAEVVLIEGNPHFGDETSGRNNQVIHAGFLYPPGSLKARLCRPGRDALFAWCADHGVPHRLAPKLIPATGQGVAALSALKVQGAAAGVTDLALLDRVALARLEPALQADAALLSPSTGIVDAAALVASLRDAAERAGALLVPAATALGGELAANRHRIAIRSADGTLADLSCRWLINAAGLGAAPLARALRGFPAAHVPPIHFARGQFAAHRGPVPFRHLVVPLGTVLEAGGALSFDPSGQARFGPDTSFVADRDYRLTADVPPAQIDAIRSWWPGLDATRLAPEFAGIRPRVTGPGRPPGDWRIDGPGVHGVPGLIHLFGIDTPGLTACLALAGHVADSVLAPQPNGVPA
ncbi:NAD(P)/FAD-dependent oxidoreductase [Gemmobacter sp.]|uniref:NAD(P)/FAD-dependent oxidoreductase n=1 Tax=Gemmobacter sp. TaxID=1898957 RepID=UPI002AFF62CD|nr:FAD-dependent oxidoreductase [Gemmobacter sp.]